MQINILEADEWSAMQIYQPLERRRMWRLSIQLLIVHSSCLRSRWNTLYLNASLYDPNSTVHAQMAKKEAQKRLREVRTAVKAFLRASLIIRRKNLIIRRRTAAVAPSLE